MIRNDEDLTRSNAALGDLYAAVAVLRREIGSASESSFALLAEGPLYEISRIRADIDAYVGADVVAKQQAPLWIRLVGPKARWGETPASVVTAFLDNLRKGIQSIAGFKATDRKLGRPSSELQLACDLEVALFAPGSFEIGVRLPAPDQGDLFPIQMQQTAKVALHEFLTAAAWAGQPYPQLHQLEALIPEAKSRRIALRAVKPFVPRKQGGVDFVELYGVELLELDRIHLAPNSIDVITKALAESIDEKEEVLEGDIREMDLDKRAFRLRNVPNRGEVPCKFGEELVSTAAELLGKRVRVVGLRRSAESGSVGPLVVTDIEKLETRRGRSDA